MAQINLLKQAVPETNLWTIVPKIFAKVLLVAFVILIVYYAWLIFDAKKIAKNIVTTQGQVIEQKKQGLNIAEREEVLVRQQQLQGISEVIANHFYWTRLLPELARVTLKSATYTSIKAGTDGLISLTGNVPTIAELDKYLQVFDLPAFNQNFSDIRIGGYSKIQSKDNNSTVTFDLVMQFNPEVIHYKSGNK